MNNNYLLKKYWLFIQAIIFQAIWFTAVLGQNQWILLQLGLLGLHFYLTPKKRADLLIVPLAFIGITIDLSFYQFNLFSFKAFPYWLLILWFAFSLNLPNSFSFLKRIPLILQILIGSFGGGASYLAAWKLGAVEYPFGEKITLTVISISWGIILPLLVYLTKEIEKK